MHFDLILAKLYHDMYYSNGNSLLSFLRGSLLDDALTVVYDYEIQFR